MLTAEQVATASKDTLRTEVLWLLAENTRLTREAAQQVIWERERIMRDWTRRAAKPPAGTEWMAPTNRLAADDGPAFGVLHVRDPAVSPHLAPPTTRRGRYLSGDVREAGPGSYIGKTLCGEPMMADEVWCSARGSLQHAVNHGKTGPCRCVELCGMCSYLSACPTIEAAWEAT
ncbi:hypothetical protein OG884_05945 [Streptosporangium sp. NBC_01755]|uniref:hypothetical protein n=1 Tax=Streptosporangium sp. NBC_01755 TaxID=2975949 RepID=UPI002DD9517A|nr:hypothetical protein [Streptosporangium sp. NBC_01755]WSD01468.1 hypothetical protein OG884_05945 [Streptosporangium sp. NBC_01755]